MKLNAARLLGAALMGWLIGIPLRAAEPPDQEHLNGVFGARLRITALRAAHGPAVELLEYLTPRNGSAMPADTQANDLWSWHINYLADPREVERRVRAHRYSMISPGVVTEAAAILVNDPDGHASLLQQSTRQP